LLGEEKTRVVKGYTDNTEAYDSYMRGMWLRNNKSTEGDWRKAILHFERAVEIDPNFSLAYVELAGAYMTLSLWHFVSTDEAIPRAQKALEHALKIDPGLPEALTLSGRIKFHYKYDWIGGESDIKKALKVNPNYGFAHMGMARILLNKGQIDKALEANSAFLESDPLSLVTQGVSAFLLYSAGRYDDAIKLCQKSLELDSEYSLTLATLGLCYIQKSEFEEAIATLRKAVSVWNSTESLCYLAYAYVVSGNREKGIEILREMDKLSEHTYVTKYYLASVQAALGDKDKAFESLELAYKERDGDLTGLKTDPKFDILRSDPRFEMVLRKIGLEK
jgi:tetratricopeptide (TPR) repeat protein